MLLDSGPLSQRLYTCHEPTLPLFALTTGAPGTVVARLDEGALISGSETCTIAQVRGKSLRER